MNIGKLRHQIELKSATTTTNTYGEKIQTFSTYATVWASIEPLTGRELESAQQISEEINYKVTIRYNSTAASEHRILFGTRTFEIDTIINPDERKEYLELMCKEIK